MLICLKVNRGVAQPGSAPEWGSGGRRFESDHPDHRYEKSFFLTGGEGEVVSRGPVLVACWISHC